MIFFFTMLTCGFKMLIARSNEKNVENEYKVVYPQNTINFF
jgi:hypothetical protein